jgi:hypothetical protein
LRRPTFQPAQDLCSLPTTQSEVIEVHLLHQPKQRQALAGAQIVLFLLEPQEDFAVRGDLLIFVETVGFLGSFEDVGDFAGKLGSTSSKS